jgi:hypothetical protein
MKILTTLKIAKNLFNDGFVPSKTNSGMIYNVLTGERQSPPNDILEVLTFICQFNEQSRNGLLNN